MEKEGRPQAEADVNGKGSRGKAGRTHSAERIGRASVFAKRISNTIDFAGMGMNRREIQSALNIATRESISTSEINSILTTAIAKKSLPNSVVLEKGHLVENADSVTGDEQINKILRLVIARETIMAAENITKKPEGKDEWEKVVESMGNIDQPLGVVKKLLSRSASLSWAMQIAKLQNTPTQEPIIKFAQELAATDGLIRRDLLNFYQLLAICEQNHIELSHLAYYIVLEAFINAREGIKTKQQDLTLLNRYQELRNVFFNEESEDTDSTELKKLNDLEDVIGGMDDSLVYRADSVGSYRLSPDGAKLRTPVGVENGKIFFDNPVLTNQRINSRARAVKSRLEGKPTKATKSAVLWDIAHPFDTEHY